jgi:hypothetical protein
LPGVTTAVGTSVGGGGVAAVGVSEGTGVAVPGPGVVSMPPHAVSIIISTNKNRIRLMIHLIQ